jgi:Protein of unknown function with HXXEE motif
MANRQWFDPILLAPIIFVCHFLEEAPTFVPWFNAHVVRGITSGMFWRVNLTALLITLIVVALEWSSRSGASQAVVLLWFGFLMFANAVFHIIGAIVDGRYVPGVITAVVFYLPYFSWLFARGVKHKRLSVAASIVAAVIGALPMAAHGYLILFRGSRLF